MNLRSIDLNLLVLLDALIEMRSVRRAGERIGLSQSATSHALDGCASSSAMSCSCGRLPAWSRHRVH